MSSSSTTMTTSSTSSIPTTTSLLPTFSGKFEAKGKTYQVTPVCFCQNLCARFLNTFSDPFYRDGGVLQWEKAVARAKVLADRFFQGEPWSGYLIQDIGISENGTGNSVVGLWTLGYDDEPGHLHAALAVSQKKAGIATGVWKWTVQELLPALHKLAVPIPRYLSDNRRDGSAKIAEANIIALAHPDHPIMHQLFTQAGFTFVKDTVIEDYKGQTDGRRKMYALPLAKVVL